MVVVVIVVVVVVVVAAVVVVVASSSSSSSGMDLRLCSFGAYSLSLVVSDAISTNSPWDWVQAAGRT